MAVIVKAIPKNKVNENQAYSNKRELKHQS